MTTLPESILAPCPFCGGADVRVNHDAGYGWWQPHCESCGCTLSEVGINSEAEAFAAWNRRAAADLAAAIPVPEAGSVEAEPVAWNFSRSYWDRHDSIPESIRDFATPLYAHPPATPLVKLEALFVEAMEWAAGQAQRFPFRDFWVLIDPKAREYAVRALSVSKTGAAVEPPYSQGPK